MITINQLKVEIDFERVKKSGNVVDDIEVLCKKASKILGINRSDIDAVEILKHSIDARKKPVLFNVYNIGVKLKNEKNEQKTVNKCRNNNVTLASIKKYIFPEMGSEKLPDRPVIIGMGPAGLFCGYMLAKYGYKPVILERGYDVDTRTKDVEQFWKTGILNTQSNVQFGEGGAGTFSDGKLNTLVKDKFGRNKEVLRIFVECGAPTEIMYECKPHIGTDVLKKVVSNMRNEIIKNDGNVRFGAKVTSIDIKDGKVKGVMVNDSEYISASNVVLAIGHSARDTFEYLHKAGIPMEAKSFAVGMRVEHPQHIINEVNYGKLHGNDLPAAPYKVTAQTSVNRGVYSFCMCPGGYVVNASSEEKRLVVNGMSYSDRAGHNANSAIIVQVTPDDFEGDGPLAGVEFQRKLEQKAYEIGQGKVPVQYFVDFVENRKSEESDNFNKPCIKGEYSYSNLRGLLPDECETAFIEGMKQFDKVIKGFSADDAILSGIESRTSSPVRIHRNENLQSDNAIGLYPCGEGAGYAGGITSAAMDGILIAEKIAAKYCI